MKPNRGLSAQYKHISLFVTPTEWDKLNFLADGKNKKVSRFLVDEVLSLDHQPNVYEPTEKRVVKSLCLKINEHEQIKERAERYNMSVSNYLLGMIF